MFQFLLFIRLKTCLFLNKFSQASNTRWLNCNETNNSRTISGLIISELTAQEYFMEFSHCESFRL